ncbi:hypothetical protein MBLNU459_g2803t1 [Dothideomycetes sp. NU459]
MPQIARLTNTQPLSEPDSADCVSSFTVPASQQSSQPRTQSSLYLTFKVAQLISSFRKRVKTRALSHVSQNKTSAKKVQTELCQEFEKQAFEQIDKYLGKERRNTRHSGGAYAKARKATGSIGETECRSPSARQANWSKLLLKQLDAKCAATRAISDLAEDDSVLLQHGTKITLPWLSTRDLIGVLCLVEALVKSLQYDALHQAAYQDGAALDEVYSANLEHLLLCLETNLLQLIISRTWARISEYLVEWQTENRLRRDDWFSEFPNALHPLTTTWPWGIRPSLAVLWGVCWMFIVEYWWDDNIKDIVFSTSTQDNDVSSFPTPQANLFRNEAANRPSPRPRHSPLVAGAFDSYGDSTDSRQRLNDVFGHDRHDITQVVSTQPRCYVDPGLADAPTIPMPEATSSISSSDVNAASLFYPHKQGIRVPGHFLQVNIKEIYSPRSAAPAGYSDSRELKTPSTAPEDLFQKYSSMPLILPDELPTTPEMPDSASERRPSIGSVSSLSETSSRHIKSERSDVLEPSSEPPRFKSPHLPRRPPRPEPTVRNGKFICIVCQSGPFDRKCEWNKHMDKHDRPYRCLRAECVQLQGFTYSGGLLRHEREVHQLHGGPKTHLYCPVVTCKRNSQKEFTRRENLAEHMRRVHKTALPDDSLPTSVDAREESEETEMPTPSSKVSDIYDLLDGPSVAAGDKRKRGSMDSEIGYDAGMLWEENKRLKLEVERLTQEGAMKDERMATMVKQIETIVSVGGAMRG